MKREYTYKRLFWMLEQLSEGGHISSLSENDYDLWHFIKPMYPSDDDFVWTTKEGTEVKLSDMTIKHLCKAMQSIFKFQRKKHYAYDLDEILDFMSDDRRFVNLYNEINKRITNLPL